MPLGPPAADVPMAGLGDRTSRVAREEHHRKPRRRTLAGASRLAVRLRHHGWWLVHDLVAHPLLALAPLRPSIALHDWTSRRLNLDEAIEPSPVPRIERRLWWLVHNLVSHRTFRWHDTTARRMAVHGWV